MEHGKSPVNTRVSKTRCGLAAACVTLPLQREGTIITMEDMARLSPYLTGHIKRFGDFVLDFDAELVDADRIKNLKIFG